MKTEINDSELVKQYCLGNDQMIGLLVTRYNSLFMATSKKYLCNRECAEDVVQDLLLKFLTYPIDKRIATFSKIRNVRAFIYTAIRNLCFDRIRQKKIVTTELFDLNMSNADSDIYNNLTIDYSIVGLSKNESIYFEEFLDGKSLDIISNKYGVSKSTVKNTIQNAKKKIITHYRKSQIFV